MYEVKSLNYEIYVPVTFIYFGKKRCSSDKAQSNAGKKD